MPNENPSNEDILIKTFFQGYLNIVPEAILIVVGTWVGPERYDRILAQLIKRVLTNLNIEAEIITDIYYNGEIEKYKTNPVICIGGSSINSVTKKYVEDAEERGFGLKRLETTAKVFTENEPLLAFVYGGGVKETYEATMDFCRNKLFIFLEKWSALYAGGRKKIEIPSNINELLNEIIYTMASSPLALEAPVDPKVSALQNELVECKNYFVIVVSVLIGFLAFSASYYATANIWGGVGVFLTIIFGVPGFYSKFLKES